MPISKGMPDFSFINYFQSAVIVIDPNDEICAYNDRFVKENEVYNFLKFDANSKTYQVVNADTDEWYRYMIICDGVGASKYVLKDIFYECNMNRYFCDDMAYTIIHFFENKSLKEEVADYFLNDFRLSQMKDLSEMAASIAHEINNPLTVISARAQILSHYAKSNQSVPSEVVHQNLEKVFTHADRIKNIVDGMRVYSRNSVKDNLTVYSIRSLIIESYNLVAGGIRDKGIEFENKLNHSPHYIMCKPNELIQVFVNLFNNAAYALSNTPFPKIKVDMVSDENFHHLFFSDNGPGIPPENESKIFSPFFTTKPVGKGTGLGLSVCLRIINSYNGSLSLDRSRGNSCFHIKLPISKNVRDTEDKFGILKRSS